MARHQTNDAIATAITSVGEFSRQIEGAFAETGDHLGRGHQIFKELEEGLNTLSGELSGTGIDGASSALQDIADRLNGVATALPAEAMLLSGIGDEAKQAAALLKQLTDHIQMITIVARSARIEAASLDSDRDSFLEFTREAFELGQAVQRSAEGSTKDAALLIKAVDSALTRQKEFDGLHRPELVSVAASLAAARSDLTAHQAKGVQLAELTGESASRIAASIAGAIVALQSGDATRQRLEHVCYALDRVVERAPGIAPALEEDVAHGPGLICRLQAEQLKDARQSFDQDIARTVRSMNALLADAGQLVAQSRTIYASDGDDQSSFLSQIKRQLSQASDLVVTCEQSGKSVDHALGIVAETLSRFRAAISGLADAVDDIILIGMNAGLRAGRVGAKGSAFVVIANELKAAADQLSACATRLKPLLDTIERSAIELRERRAQGDAAGMSALEPLVLAALRDVEDGNARLGAVMDRLSREGAEFEILVGHACDRVNKLVEASAGLPALAKRIVSANPAPSHLALSPAELAELDVLFARYTMERERDIHRDVLRDFGLASAEPVASPQDEDDGVMLF
jgi:hypothetical protein